MTQLSELETTSALPQAIEIRKQLSHERFSSIQTHAKGPIYPSEDSGQMGALSGVLRLSKVLSELSSAAGALELGPYEPAKVVKIIETNLREGKTLQKAMEMMFKAKVFNGSEARFTFIRETSITMRDPYP